MSRVYDWTHSEENPLITYESLEHLKTGLEAAFGSSFSGLSELFKFLIKHDENGYYFETEDGEKFFIGSDKGDDYVNLEARVKAIEDELDEFFTALEEII